MSKATGVFTFVYWSDGSFRLVLSYDGVGFHYNHLSSLMGNMRMLLEHPAVWHWGPRLWLVRVPESQYSAVYSVPWSPLHSSVNSFTISFTLLLFTRSLQDRGHAHFYDMYGRNIFSSVLSVVAMSHYLSICCEKLCFCSVVTRDEGNPGGCSASFNHTPSREKQCLFRPNSTSANWSMRLRGAPPPMPCWWQDGEDRLGEGSCS